MGGKRVETFITHQPNGKYWVHIPCRHPEFPKVIPFFQGLYLTLEDARAARNEALKRRKIEFPSKR